ncbi:MAG: fibronectin type III domain-containing protein [Nitrospira sp.]
MLRLSPQSLSLSSTLIGLLLLTASCGNLQDPASGTSAHIAAEPEAQAPSLTHPSLDPSSQPSNDDPASMPTPTAGDPGLPASNPSLPQNSPGITEPPGTLPPWQTRESLILRRVTLAWDPSASGDADGYRVYVRSESTVSPYYLEAGSATQLSMSLFVGQRYSFTVVAYNAAGESPPAQEFTFDVD